MEFIGLLPQTFRKIRIRAPRSLISARFSLPRTGSFGRASLSTMRREGTAPSGGLPSQPPEKDPKLWIVADMEETLLLPKAMRNIWESPCWAPLSRLLSDDRVRLLIVTSDDGHRPFGVWEQFFAREEFSPRVLLSTSQGCALWVAHSSSQREIKAAKIRAYPDYPQIALDKPFATSAATEIWLAFLRDVRPWRGGRGAAHVPPPRTEKVVVSHECFAERHPDWMPGFRKIFWRMWRKSAEAGGGAESDAPVSDEQDEALRGLPRSLADLDMKEEDLFTAGLFFRGPVFWVSQLGPIDQWGADLFMDGVRWGSSWLMRCPRPWSETVLQENAGVESGNIVQASAAPRSVCFTPRGVGKEKPVQFLVDVGRRDVLHEEVSIHPGDVVLTFGDQPDGNDSGFKKLSFPFFAVRSAGDTAAVLSNIDVDAVLRGGAASEQLLALTRGSGATMLGGGKL